MTRQFQIILFWVASIFFVSIYTHENPELIETAKKYFVKEIYCLQIGDKDDYKLLIPLTNLVNEKNNNEY